ncbi:hypothetical protein EPO44_11795 [bacterium]|nr:MAG: hypothetical protein EPO44_11795 [bacterium]
MKRKELTMSEKRLTRRDAIKKAVYTIPIILTLAASPSFASAGSGDQGERGGHWVRHKKTTWQFLWWSGTRNVSRFQPDSDS